jgi:hypothetical protein
MSGMVLPELSDTLNGFGDFQPKKPERRIVVEGGNQQHVIIDFTEIQVLVPALVKKQGKFILPIK